MQQPGKKRKFSRFQAIAILVGLIAVIAVLVIVITGLVSHNTTVTGVTAYELPCDYSDTLRAFGDLVLYYDGASIHAISPTGAVRWSFKIGSGAGFDCNESIVVAWAGSTIYILDRSGNSTYNDNLGQEIQFARAGTQYIAAVIGESDSPTLTVKDHSGAHMDEESDAYEDLLILDVGFYGNRGQYMWTLALDVFSTASNTVLNTFEVGKMNTGEVSLGSPITYGVMFENSILRVIGTRQMRSFSYNGTEDTQASVLVYGWRLIDREIPQKGSALMLFAPTAQTENQFDIRELRLIMGSLDKRYSLPDTCVGAAVRNKQVYAVSGDTLFRASTSDNRFTKYALPLDAPVTRLIGTMTGGYAIVSCDTDVYVITLPEV